MGLELQCSLGVFCLMIVAEMSYSLLQFGGGAAWGWNGSRDLEIGLMLGFWLAGKSRLGLGLDLELILCLVGLILEMGLWLALRLELD